MEDQPMDWRVALVCGIIIVLLSIPQFNHDNMPLTYNLFTDPLIRAIFTLMMGSIVTTASLMMRKNPRRKWVLILFVLVVIIIAYMALCGVLLIGKEEI